MIEILFLGTGCMQPTKTRNHSGILVSFGKENILDGLKGEALMGSFL